jgi:hypothetical protein
VSFYPWKRRSAASWLAREVEFAPSRPIAGHFSLRHSPYIAEPLAAVQTERNRELWMIASWQSAKSLWLELSALWLLANDGQAAMWNSPTDMKAKEFSSTRFSELLDDCAPVRALLAGDRFSNTKTLKRFINAWLIIQGVDELGNLQSKSVGYLFNDENWLWPPGRVAETRARVTKFRRWLHLNATTGGEIHTNVKMRITEDGQAVTIGPDETAQAWEASDQREWQLRCPHCRDEAHGGYFTPRWEQMDFGGDDSRNASGEWVFSKVRRNLRLVCPLCSAPIRPGAKTLAALNDGARYVVTNPENTGGIIAWHYNALAHFDWVKLAEEWLRAQKTMRLGSIEQLKTFVQRRLAETWVADKFLQTTAELMAGGYKLGEKWPDAQHTFLTVDVQKDCFYAVARGWGKGTSRQLAVERLLTIDDVEKMRLTLGIPPNWVGIDAGWNMDMVLVYCARFGYAALNGVKRRAFYHAEDNLHRIYSPVRWHNIGLGTIHERGQRVPEFLFSTQAINDRLETLRSIVTPAPIWTVADDTPELFKKHMDACRKIERRTAQGLPFFEWHQIGSRPDHWRDAELMQVVLASMAGLVGAEASPADTPEPASEKPPRE